MKRRHLLQAGGLGLLGCMLPAAMPQTTPPADWQTALVPLRQAIAQGQVASAAVYARQGQTVLQERLGAAPSPHASFLLASISKPISTAALMRLYEQQAFDLEDPVRRFLPTFQGDGREQVTIRHLLTHRSGLPDQLPDNAELRRRHAGLERFVEAALRTPLRFAPGSRFGYSSMAILLASEIAQRLTDKPFAELVEETVFRPLQMDHSALGVGRLERDTLVRCQTEQSAPEAGAGSDASSDWDWNSDYWRQLGAPWGGAHGSAADVGRFLEAFLHPDGRLLRQTTVDRMLQNQNPPGMTPRGLGFDVGSHLSGGTTSEQTFGHTGSTGTLCWADPQADALAVVLTTLPARAAAPHPRSVTGQRLGAAMG